MTDLPHVYVDRFGELWIFELIAAPRGWILCYDSGDGSYMFSEYPRGDHYRFLRDRGMEFLGSL